MPTFRKVGAEPAPEPARTEIGRAYDALLAGFAAGEWGEVELDEGERRVVVRARLQAAAKRCRLALRFRPGPGPMIFCVELAAIGSAALPAVASPPSTSLPPAPEPRRQGGRSAGRVASARRRDATTTCCPGGCAKGRREEESSRNHGESGAIALS